MPLSTKITQGFTAVGTKVKALDLATVKSVNSVTPNSSGNVKITMISGNAGSATKLETARTISLTGDVTGSVSFDGTDNVSITTTVADDSHNHTIANVDNLQSSLNAKAPLASPTFTGTPKAPTATSGTNTTQIATTAFVTTAIANKTSVASATKATQDGSGNVITDTYLTKTDASSTYLGKTAKADSASSADSVAWDNVSGKPSSFTPASHNQASSTINALTGYSKPSSTGALSTSDTLNSALGKLEKALDDKLSSSGNASTATSAGKWTTARTITLGGDASGSVSIDGSENKTLTVTVKDDSHAHVISNVDGLQDALDGKASTGSVTDAIATAKSYTDTAVAGIVDSSPEALNTLNELAAALGDDPNFATTVTNLIGTKLNSSGGNISGHIYLTGAKETSSTSNTSQIVFGTADNNHVAISSNTNALVINPNTTQTTNQIVLYLDKASLFPSGISANVTGNLTGTASKATSDASGNNIVNTYATKSSLGDITTNLVAYFEECLAG